MRSLAKHVNDILHDHRCLKNTFIGFTETQMKPSNSSIIADDTIKDFKINLNNTDDKFSSLAYGCQDDIAIIRKCDINVIFITSLRKGNFSEHFLTLFLVY